LKLKTKYVTFDGKISKKNTFALWKINLDLTLKGPKKRAESLENHQIIFAKTMLFKP